jgi:UDPglucose 6-dehydrogenase/GDP-mannose 6-dehydrogenase
VNISIIGTGYVGLVTGVCLAEKGHSVVCVDIDGAKVSALNQGIAPIYEQGLTSLLKKNIGRNLRASTDLGEAVLQTDLSLITVGTPFDGRAIDLTSVRGVAQEMGQVLKNKSTYHVVVVKSTVAPGTTDDIVGKTLETVSGKAAGKDFGLGMNPEFLTEGQAVRDFMFPDRIILGGIDARTIDALEQVYTGHEDVPRIKTNNMTAEMIKYASNSLLATMISFSNEFANLCSTLGDVDIVEVMNGVHLSNYLSYGTSGNVRQFAQICSFLTAGCGYGGSCLPKDVKALIVHGRQLGSRMALLEAVNEINERQPTQVIELLKKHFPSLSGVRVTVLGLSFRPDTGDTRESPALHLIRRLQAEQALITAYDPVAIPEARKQLGHSGVRFCERLRDSIRDAQALVLVTRWDEFRKLPTLLAEIDPQPVFVDGRRMLEKHDFKSYEGIGWRRN